MSTALIDVLSTVTSTSCPEHYNFHLHTLHSDGRLQPADLMQQAVNMGLKGLAITDHHSVAGYWQARQWLTHRQRGAPTQAPTLWSGVEITAQLKGGTVHILGYDFDPSAPELGPYLKGERLLDERAAAQPVITAIHAAGGVAVLAHPARYHRPATELVAAVVEMGIDGIEAYYDYRNQETWTPSPNQTRLMEQLGAQYHLQLTCGTDTHGLDIRRRR